LFFAVPALPHADSSSEEPLSLERRGPNIPGQVSSSIPPSSAPTSILPAPKKAGSQEIGRSRGGLTTKLHVAVDALGNPLRVILSAGQIADIDHASALIENLPGQSVVADKGHDADHFVAKIEATGVEAAIPPRSNRLTQRDFDRHLYRARNLIEHFFARLKHFRRIATRYDKLANSFLSFIHLACTFVWLA
jgi:transposase